MNSKKKATAQAKPSTTAANAASEPNTAERSSSNYTQLQKLLENIKKTPTKTPTCRWRECFWHIRERIPIWMPALLTSSNEKATYAGSAANERG